MSTHSQGRHGILSTAAILIFASLLLAGCAYARTPTTTLKSTTTSVSTTSTTSTIEYYSCNACSMPQAGYQCPATCHYISNCTVLRTDIQGVRCTVTRITSSISTSSTSIFTTVPVATVLSTTTAVPIIVTSSVATSAPTTTIPAQQAGSSSCQWWNIFCWFAQLI